MIMKKYKILLMIAFAFLSLNLANQVSAGPVKCQFKRKDSVTELTKLMDPNPFQKLTSSRKVEDAFASSFNVTVRRGNFTEAATFIIDLDLKTIQSRTSQTFSYGTGALIAVVPTKQELLLQLMNAINTNNLEKVKEIINRKVIDLNKDCLPDDSTALSKAISCGKTKIVKYFITLPEIELNTKDNNGNNSLILAVLSGNAEIVRILVNCSKELNIDEKNNDRNTPLILAASSGNAEIVRTLVNCGKPLNINEKNIALFL